MAGTFPNLADLTEKEWDAQIFNSQKGLATMLGWRLIYHTLRSKGSRSGFPDRVLIRDRIIYAEMKTLVGKPSDNQVEFLDGLARAGGEVYLWKPCDLEEIGRILSKRWLFVGAHGDDERGLVLDGAPASYWQPDSTWLPGIGRRDQRPAQGPGAPRPVGDRVSDQLGIFDQPAPVAHARTTDPWTSHAAARSLDESALRESQANFLAFFRELGPMTHETLVEKYRDWYIPRGWKRQSQSGLRTRASELVKLGFLRDSGKTVTLDSGRQSIIWEPVAA